MARTTMAFPETSAGQAPGQRIPRGARTGGELRSTAETTSAIPQGIFSVRVDGSDRQMLVAHAAQPAYSPDGKELAYVGWTGPARGGEGVFVANADRSDPRTVSSRQADSPSWSPVGGLIAFARFLGGAVRVVRPDGSGERVIDALTGRRVVWSAPLWSPNGQLVAFTEGPLGSGGLRFKSSIVVARRDGGGRRVVVRRFARSKDPSPCMAPACRVAVRWTRSVCAAVTPKP